MRVLQVNKFLHAVGGAETVLFQTADLLKAHGHEVSYFAMQDDRNIPTEDEAYFVSNVAYEGHRQRNATDRLKLPLVAGRFLYSREAAQNIDALIKEKPPSIAHLHNIYHQISPSILSPLKRRGIPAVMTLHDYKMICPNYTLFSNGAICERCKGHRYYEAVLQRCVKGSSLSAALCAVEAYTHRITGAYEKGIDAYIAPSQFMRRKMSEFGIDPERIVYLPNFLNLERYSPRYEPGSYCVYAGRLERVKGVGTLIEAMQGGEAPATELRIAGDGDLRGELEHQVQEGGRSNVSFLGRLPRDELGRLIQDSLFVVVPSEWYENAPMSVLEAFAYGKPVIGTNIGGIPELIEEGVTGLLVEPGNVADLRRAIDRLAANPQLAVEMGRNARRYIEARHGAEQHYQGLLAIYEAAGASRAGGSSSSGGAR
jgi:glycosyltransferase involved in cell wall biosynthesis